jgi:hypothetical protein
MKEPTEPPKAAAAEKIADADYRKQVTEWGREFLYPSETEEDVYHSSSFMVSSHRGREARGGSAFYGLLPEY